MAQRLMRRAARPGDRNLRDERETSEGESPARLQSCSDWQSVSILTPGGSIERDRCVENGPVLTRHLVAKRKTLFDDRPVEISELTYVIKQDLASLNQQIAGLQALTQAQHPKTNRSKTDQEGEHNDNVSTEVLDALCTWLTGYACRLL